MTLRSSVLVPAAICLAAQLVTFPAVAGMRTEGGTAATPIQTPTRGPSSSGTQAGATDAKGGKTQDASRPTPVKPASPYVGKVVTTRGNKAIAEIQGGARQGEKFAVYDDALRRCGESTVTMALDKELYVLEPTAGRQAAAGHRLARVAAP